MARNRGRTSRSATNIAPVLFRLQEYDNRCYQRIVDTIRLILPFFFNFALEPQYNRLLLNWRERNSDQVFSVAQASDSMLRVLSLVTLLLQPERDLPDVLILDEPELGLHLQDRVSFLWLFKREEARQMRL